jgi:isopenicillin N synthase-like dioxygenase
MLRAAARAARAQRVALPRALCSDALPEAVLPEVDLSALDWRRHGPAAAAERAAALRALRAACESGSGAFTAITHAFVPPALLERCYAHTRAFHALPAAAKLPLHHTRDTNGRGWVPLFEEAAYEEGAVVSHVTSFDLAREMPRVEAGGARGLGPNVWPEERLPGFAADVNALYDATTVCAHVLFRAFADMLALPQDTFAASLTPRSRGTMRLMQYPGTRSAAAAAARNVGISAHTDFETHTLLHQDAPGLQLAQRSGDAQEAWEWRSAPVPDATQFTVIIGDMLERWTNGTLRATRHRVAHVPWERHALVRFVGVDGATAVAPLPQFGAPRYAAVTQEAHLDAAVAEAEARRDAGVAAGIIPRSAAEAR